MQSTYSPLLLGRLPTIEAVWRLMHYSCATRDLRYGAASVQRRYREIVTSDHAEGPQYHVVPIDGPLRGVNIVREVGRLPALSGEHDDAGG